MEWHVYILTFLLGMLASAIAGIVLSCLQFSRSIAGYRLSNVKEATIALIKEHNSPNPHTGTLRNKYRYSLGVIIDRMIKTYGANQISRSEGTYPCLQSFGEKDRWDLFNQYIRPVINDIHNYSFIGLMPKISKLVSLRSLVKLLIQLETVTSELDAIRLMEKRKKLNILDIYENETLRIKKQHMEGVDNQIQMLINEYATLEVLWKKWLESIKMLC